MTNRLIAGYMARQGGGGTTGASPAGGAGLGGLLGGLLGGAGGGAHGGLSSMIDMNRDGNPLDDILRMAGRGGR